MIILAHRGFWESEKEKNTLEALEKSLTSGFGLETDIRDYLGELVISHDMAADRSVRVDDLFSLVQSLNSEQPLALNIKADGLQEPLLEKINRFGIENYFVFDMSIPDQLGYQQRDFPVFTRQSEFESPPVCYDQVQGVWLDEFLDHWIDRETLLEHHQNGKKTCIVSPELHSAQPRKRMAGLS